MGIEASNAFELIRWARHQATVDHVDGDGKPTRLTPTEGHVLLVLATYAGRDRTAWPAVRTIASDCGLKPYHDGRCSAVSAALAQLERLGLIRTTQGGSGRSAIRELLCEPERQPHVQTGGSARQPHVSTDASLTPTREASLTPTRRRTTKRTTRTTTTPALRTGEERNNQNSLTPGREAAAAVEPLTRDELEALSEDDRQERFREIARLPAGEDRELHYHALREVCG